jgi:hypothetical protein
MLAAMNALRFSAATAALAAILAAAAALGACGDNLTITNCVVPVPGATAADGGPDPCHCAPPPSLNVTTCGCLSGDPQEVANYQACMTLFREEEDAGEGGPIPGCNGQCWPIPPPDWTPPLLLWVGAESSAPPCPELAPAPLYGGYANGTFALACTSNAGGTCRGLGDVCGPEGAEGFWTCVFREGDVDCPLVGPYIEKHVFYEAAGGQPILPSTFCCPAAPLPSP